MAELPVRVHRMESCDNMGSKWVLNFNMTYHNKTKDKSPLVYRLSRSVKGVDDTVDHEVNYIGFRQEWRA